LFWAYIKEFLKPLSIFVMLSALDSQFKINEEGQIFYQENPSNPLPGQIFAYARKGDSILAPQVALYDSDLVKADEKEAARLYVQAWLGRHIASVLEPLVALAENSDLKDSAKPIAAALYESLGVIPREKLEPFMAGLDQEGRRALRAKKIRLGPILVFLPALNKPAAVRLRGLLWGLFYGHALPMPCPKDGIVSYGVDAETVNRAFHQSIGYPVYGPRAIRIDMLDRVISAIYDSAKEGKFQAQHAMAEWLGCTIDSLYEILQAMGHRKIEQPVSAVENAQSEENGQQSLEAEKTPLQSKPELAMFALKKGKAFEKQRPSKPERQQAKPQAKTPHKPKEKPRREKPKVPDMPKIISAGPQKRIEDSPFAILEQLKKKADV
jgi:ATP-dependent RNA helicase SUPV3L1/SUV3